MLAFFKISTDKGGVLVNEEVKAKVRALEAINSNPKANKDICNNALKAMKEFAKSSSDTNLINQDVDKDFHENLANLLLTLRDKTLHPADEYDMNLANGSLTKLPETLAKLLEQLNYFKSADEDTAHQQAYQNAIDLVERVQKVFNGAQQNPEAPKP